MTMSRGASAGRALRARRWPQESRQCARSSRVSIFSVAQRSRGGEGKKAEFSRQTVWLRITFSQVRRMLHRGQSRQSIGAEGGWAGDGRGAGEESA